MPNEDRSCKNCKQSFTVAVDDFTFYEKMGVPAPNLCLDCRFRRRGPFKLYSRTCTKCGKAIQTSYAPDRPEIVYCEQCYQAEVV